MFKRFIRNRLRYHLVACAEMVENKTYIENYREYRRHVIALQILTFFMDFVFEPDELIFASNGEEAN